MDTVEVEVDAIKHETDDAMLVVFEGEEVWVPLSQVDKIVRRKTGTALITMQTWIATKKGFI